MQLTDRPSTPQSTLALTSGRGAQRPDRAEREQVDMLKAELIITEVHRAAAETSGGSLSTLLY